MIGATMIALLVAVPVGVPVGGGETPGPWRERAPVPPDGAPDAGAGLDRPRGVEHALSELVLEHGERARLWSYGTSGSGRPLLALELHAERAGAGWRVSEGPTIVVVADLERDAAAGAREVLAWAEHLVLDVEALARARWLLVPAPAPDRLAHVDPAVDLAWDFPAGWDPWATRGAGAYPLRTPETRALAAGLNAWGTGTALVVVGAEERRAGGSLEAYARSLGWKVLGLPEAREGDRARAAALLPRIELDVLSVRRATAELWEVELGLRESDAGAGVADGILEVAGVPLLAAARRGDAGAVPLSLDAGAGIVDLTGATSPGPRRVLLLVRGEAEDRARIRVALRGFAPRVAELSLVEAAATAGD